VSFTGSTAVGRWIAEACGRSLKKVSLELGGKNAFVVCDDADLDAAAKWLCLSAFSNAGQRCAAGSRAIVFDAVYDLFVEKLLAAAERLKVGPEDGDDFGPVINERQLNHIVDAIERARQGGARVLTGGARLSGERHAGGWYLGPTVIEEADPRSETSRTELFGPVVSLYRARDFADALAMANDSSYGLTACIHTRSIDRATHFAQRVRTGVAVVNAGTYGSEPHMPFGGLGQSGNGSREPGTEALEVYSELKDIYLTVEPSRL
jgi:alpha-ketoglutaric semialdehyde dehydrogenase